MPVHDLRNETWVLVADGEKALFLVNDGDAEYPVLNVRREEHQDNPPDIEQSANRPGRQSESSRAATLCLRGYRLARTCQGPLRRRAGRDPLRAGAQGQVRPDRARGRARTSWESCARSSTRRSADKVVGEVDKTLTNHPIDEIERILKSELTRAA